MGEKRRKKGKKKKRMRGKETLVATFTTYLYYNLYRKVHDPMLVYIKLLYPTS